MTAHEETIDRRLPLPASYPMEFKHWAWWFIDLSVNAPTLQQQCMTLYPKWLELQGKQPHQAAKGDVGDGE